MIICHRSRDDNEMAMPILLTLNTVFGELGRIYFTGCSWSCQRVREMENKQQIKRLVDVQEPSHCLIIK